MTLEIGRPIGDEHPPFVVAALDGVQLGSLEAVLAAIDASAESCCDAVKLRTIPWAWCAKTFERADDRGLAALARAVDEEAVSRLDWCGAPAFALQFDWSDLDLIACAARTGKPLFVSVGRATDLELEEVIETARSNGNGGIALLHPAGAGLDRIAALRRHRCVVGVQDLGPGDDVAHEAIARGASVVVRPFGQLANTPDLAATVRACELAWASGGATPVWSVN